MNVSVRSYLMAGAAAATAATLTLTGVQVTPQNVTVPAHTVSAEPHLSQAMVSLLASASRLTAALPVPPSPPTGGAVTVAPVAAAPTAFAIAPNLANSIDNFYVTVEPWVRYGFDVAAYALGFIPYVGGWAGGLLIDGYNFGQSLVASGVFNFTDWLRGDGGIVSNLVDFGVDVVYAFVWLGIDVASTFIPLPPLPWYPPRPPIQGPFLAAAGLAAPTAATAPVIGNNIPSAVNFVTNAILNMNNMLRSTSEGITSDAINALKPLLGQLGLGFVNDVASLQPLQALGTETGTPVDSVSDQGPATVNFVNPGIAAKDARASEVSGVQAGSPAQVPAAVVESLKTSDVVDPSPGSVQPTAPVSSVVAPDAGLSAAAGAAAATGTAAAADKAASKDAGPAGGLNAGAAATGKAGHATKSKADKPAGKHADGKAHAKAGAAK